MPILLRSGDCIVMGGAARLCVHGVPAVLASDAAGPPRLLRDTGALLASRFWETDEEDGAPCDEAEAVLLARYLSTCRINFNLRQCWPNCGGE